MGCPWAGQAQPLQDVFGLDRSDSDYEFWDNFKAEHVPLVLLQLIKDRFKTHAEFAAWLKQKGIPSEFTSY